MLTISTVPAQIIPCQNIGDLREISRIIDYLGDPCRQIYAALDSEPRITIDDGAELVTTLHRERPGQIGQVTGGTGETTTGVVRLRAMAD
jgi:hypothetical protein